jgi:hypothetical protein
MSISFKIIGMGDEFLKPDSIEKFFNVNQFDTFGGYY